MNVALSDPVAGFIGVATLSCVHAVRSRGVHGVLQELWVDPRHRAERLSGRIIAVTFPQVHRSTCGPVSGHGAVR